MNSPDILIYETEGSQDADARIENARFSDAAESRKLSRSANVRVLGA
ncbi:MULTISPECIES: hypothetical protein [Pirellulaceae]|uniref:Uncharacterized protein n=1 Tax=Aporhodopirellula rubra TaxID=980271 RepID=A0A7W5E1Y2_9BACT|nr:MULTISPECIES: hypothetical protein [Pirellulaceae]EMI41837.1 hypothetical protein RRSWK_05652 [Rhodopirellula sp. SWK7]MBB3207797.1 hypothetical protein [Aporhodopirellula rubra]